MGVFHTSWNQEIRGTGFGFGFPLFVGLCGWSCKRKDITERSWGGSNHNSLYPNLDSTPPAPTIRFGWVQFGSLNNSPALWWSDGLMTPSLDADNQRTEALARDWRRGHRQKSGDNQATQKESVVRAWEQCHLLSTYLFDQLWCWQAFLIDGYVPDTVTNSLHRVTYSNSNLSRWLLLQLPFYRGRNQGSKTSCDNLRTGCSFHP